MSKKIDLEEKKADNSIDKEAQKKASAKASKAKKASSENSIKAENKAQDKQGGQVVGGTLGSYGRISLTVGVAGAYSCGAQGAFYMEVDFKQGRITRLGSRLAGRF